MPSFSFRARSFDAKKLQTELAERMGHSKASMSLDVYTHVMAPEEARPDRILALVEA